MTLCYSVLSLLGKEIVHDRLGNTMIKARFDDALWSCLKCWVGWVVV